MDYKNYHRDKAYLENEKLFKNIFMTRFKIAMQFKKSGKVLDIGTSTGAMLDIFSEHGWETWGVEPSNSAKYASQKGHKIVKGYFEKVKLPSNFFDIVIMNHVLEHVDDAVIVLKKINKLLKKDGIVLIDVPNAGGFASRILKDKWPYRAPEEHTYQFTRKSLSEIFEKAGFKVIHFESRSGIFEFANPIYEIWLSLSTFKKRFFKHLINIPYDIFVTAFNTGDSMTLVGRKI